MSSVPFSNHPLFTALFKFGTPGLISDFDGTLSPIVALPKTAEMLPIHKQLLQELLQLLPVIAIVSGRKVSELVQKVGLDGIEYFGNHGMERWRNGEGEWAPEVNEARPSLEKLISILRSLKLDRVLGMEDKGLSVSLHFRNVNNPVKAMDSLRGKLHIISTVNDLQLNEGKMIFEFRPNIPVHKGTALQTIIEAHQVRTAIYIGDNTTDADAFRTAHRLREINVCHCVAIGVHSSQTPDVIGEIADFMVEGISGVTALLQLLKEIREE